MRSDRLSGSVGHVANAANASGAANTADATGTADASNPTTASTAESVSTPAFARPTRAESLHWLLRECRVLAGVTIVMTLYSTITWRQPFGSTLVYTLCTALPIQTLIEVGRYGFAALLRRRFPDSPRARRPWPGWRVMAPWVIVAGTVGYSIGHELGDWLTGNHGAPTLLIHDGRTFMLNVLAVFVPAIGLMYFFEARARMAEMEARTQAALRTAAENQLKLLEAQLEPHMLFNTLANLRVLIGTDPARAQQMLDRLIDFLRATLDASRCGSYPLEAEFVRLRDYLDLMQIRMGPRLTYRLDLPPALAALPVPPLLLQPLVENAIRHGLEPKVDGGWLAVSAALDGAQLRLSVRDTGVGLGVRRDPNGAGAPPGGVLAGLVDGSSFGTQQVRERLAALYGRDGTLELTDAIDNEGGTLAVVRLPVG